MLQTPFSPLSGVQVWQVPFSNQNLPLWPGLSLEPGKGVEAGARGLAGRGGMSPYIPVRLKN